MKDFEIGIHCFAVSRSVLTGQFGTSIASKRKVAAYFKEHKFHIDFNHFTQYYISILIDGTLLL